MTDAYAYLAFGTAWQGGNGSTNAYRYPGEYGYYRDLAAVQYVRARWLAVGTGRWLSEDPLRFEAGDFNLYCYVGNEPVARTDASGLAVGYVYTGVATCFDDSSLFCNNGSPGCPHYAVGFTAAWPNVCYMCGPHRCPTVDKPCNRTYCRHKDYSGSSVQPVKCGATILVQSRAKPKCSLHVQVVDVGPNFSKYPGNIVDLNVKASQFLEKCVYGHTLKKPCSDQGFRMNVKVVVIPQPACDAIHAER